MISQASLENPEVAEQLSEMIRVDAVRVARRFFWRSEPEDLRQEGLLAILEALADGRELEPALARHIAWCRMTKRAASRRNRPTDGLSETIELDLVDRDCDMEAVLDVREAMGELSTSQRESMLTTLSGTAGQTHQDLGLSKRAHEARLARARKRLRERLGDAYEHMRRRFPMRYGPVGRAEAKRRAKRESASAESSTC